MEFQNPVRKSLIQQIDEGITSWTPEELVGERSYFFDAIVGLLEEWGNEFSDRPHEIDTHECDDPIRSLITLKGDPSYVITIHDPMQVRKGSAETITGVDYSVQHPTRDGQEKFLFVQAKQEDYPVKPKQYFAMGGFYMYLQYIINRNWWQTRLREQGEYVTKREEPHQEPFFVSIHYDPNNSYYLPLSSVLRTYGPSTYLVNYPYKDRDEFWVTKHTGTFAEFSDPDQHIVTSFSSFDEFYSAAERCDIGLTHSSETSVTERKMDGVMFLADTLTRPNVNIIEIGPDELGDYVESLT
jgi:hypothetical protein